MNYKMMGRFLGQILFIEAVLMIPALCISLYCGDDLAVRAFVMSIAISAAVAGMLYLGLAVIFLGQMAAAALLRFRHAAKGHIPHRLLQHITPNQPPGQFQQFIQFRNICP